MQVYTLWTVYQQGYVVKLFKSTQTLHNEEKNIILNKQSLTEKNLINVMCVKKVPSGNSHTNKVMPIHGHYLNKCKCIYFMNSISARICSYTAQTAYKLCMVRRKSIILNKQSLMERSLIEYTLVSKCYILTSACAAILLKKYI